LNRRVSHLPRHTIPDCWAFTNTWHLWSSPPVCFSANISPFLRPPINGRAGYQREAGQFSWRARMLQHRSRTVYLLHSPDAGLPGSDNMVLRLSRLTTTSDKL
jgi:hypothetical protein